MSSRRRPKNQEPKRSSKGSHRLYAVVVIVLAIAIVLMSVYLLFYVQAIRVVGNEYCTNTEIVQAVQDDPLSVNSLYVLAKYGLGRGKVPDCIEDMKVSMENPWTLRVTVTEKEAVGYMPDESEYICFDKEGLVLRQVVVPPVNIPLVEGIEVENTGLYEYLESENTQIFEQILEATRELARYDLSSDKIVCDHNRLYLYIGDVCVSLGTTVSAEQIAQIEPILEELGSQKGTLHLENYTDSQSITFDIDEFPE